MLKLFQKKNGAVTVFLTLIMVPMLFVAEFAMDSARIYGAKVIISGAGDLAMNAALTEYDKVLQDMYGLFATSTTEDELKENLGKYFKQTIEGIEPTASDEYSKVVLEQIKTLLKGNPEADLQIHNLIDLESLGVEDSSYVSGSELYYNETVKKQIVEYMKYRGPVSIGSGLLEKIGMVTDVKKQQKVIEKKAAYDEALNEIQEALVALYMSLQTYVTYSLTNSENYNDNIPAFYNDAYANLVDVMDPLMIAGMCNAGLAVPSVTATSIGSLEAMQETVNSIYTAVGVERTIYSTVYNKSSFESYLNYLYAIKNNYAQITGVIDSHPDLVPDKVEKPEAKTDEQLEKMSPEQLAAYEAEYNAQMEKYNEYLEQLSLFNSLANDVTTMQAYVNDLKYFQITSDQAFWDVSKNFALSYWIGRLESNKQTLTKQKTKYDAVCSLQELAEGIVDSLDALSQCITEAENAGKEWKGSIDELGESALKQTMGQQFKEVAGDIKKEDIEALKSNMSVNLTYFTTFKQSIETIKYFDVQVFQKNVSLMDIYKQVARNNGKVTGFNKASASDAMAAVSTTPLFGLCSDGDFSKLATVAGEMTVVDTAFYKYLDEFCKKLPQSAFESSDSTTEGSGDAEETEEQKKAKGEKSGIINAVNKAKADSEKEPTVKKKMPGSDDTKYYTDFATTLLNATGGKTQQPVADMSDDDAAATQTKNAGSGLADFDFDKLASSLANMAESFRDDIYVTEYMTEMFSCYTTGKNPSGGDAIAVKSLSGYPIDADHNYLFGCEQEYILWGQRGDNTNKNITYTTASIFAIRYALNMAYAFTSAEIQAYTLGIATAIAGWTVFGVPLVQTVLILAIALGETALDVVELKAGKDVVIYKSPTTWRLSPTGLATFVANGAIDKAKEEAIKVANTAIQKTSQMIENFANESIENVESSFNSYAEEAVDTLVNNAVAGIVTPLTSTLQMYVLNQASATENAKEIINTQLDKIYSDMEASINAEPSGLAKEVKKYALQYFKDNMLSTVKNKFNDAVAKLNSDTEQTTQAIIGSINTQVESFRGTLKTKVKEYTTGSATYASIKKSCQDELKGYLNDAEKKTSENASKAISSFADKMSYSISSAGSGGSAGTSSASKTEKGALFTLNYQEYVKIFVLIAMIGDDQKQVARMCDLIKMNLCASTTAPSKNFKWSGSYTMFNMRAKAAVRTTIDYETKQQHTPTRFMLEYNSYLGY